MHFMKIFDRRPLRSGMLRGRMLRGALLGGMLSVCGFAGSVDAQVMHNLRADLAAAPILPGRSFLDSTLAAGSVTAGEKKSPWLAGLLSAAVPGAGQVYAHAPLWRTILYGGIEATAWTLSFIYNAKGDKGTDDFQNFADTHWDVTRYVSWIAQNYQRWPDEEVNKAQAAEALAAIYRSNDPNLPPWDRIDFAQLNKLERSVVKSFSHTLPAHGEQQYYEEIGKYTQYRAGWDDHDAVGDTLVYDNSKVTDRNRSYTASRAQTNRYYDYATAAVGTILLNHVVSMLDALFQTRSYNASIRAGLHGSLTPLESPYPELTLRVGF
jgi:hypothetical protein